jgi:hypothetical protein
MLQMNLLVIVKFIGANLPIAKSVVAAYIDPNTGGMLFQILAVMFGVISGALLLFSGRIKGLYYRVRRRFQEPEAEVVDEGDVQNEDEV